MSDRSDGIGEWDLPPKEHPEPYGQAALLLVESLIHGLLARGVIRSEEAIEIVSVAIEVKADIGPEMGDSPEELRRSLRLLEAIRASLAGDLDRERAIGGDGVGEGIGQASV